MNSIQILKWTLVTLYLISIPINILQTDEPREPLDKKIVAIRCVIDLIVAIWIWSVLS